MTSTNSHATRVIHKKAGCNPVVTTINTLFDVDNILGIGRTRHIQVGDDILVICLDNEYESNSFTDSYFEDEILCAKSIRGDVIVTGYDFEFEEAVSLNKSQISSWLYTLRNFV